MSEHTPGPWTTSPDAVPDHHTQITVYAGNGDRVATVFQTPANASLIAAAPDMLEALKAARGNSVDDSPHVWGQIAAAIAKAEEATP